MLRTKLGYNKYTNTYLTRADIAPLFAEEKLAFFIDTQDDIEKMFGAHGLYKSENGTLTVND